MYYCVWGVAAVKCTVWLWIGMALNIWVCDSVPKIRCVPLWCVWVWYIVYICHYAYSYLASGPTQLSVASSVVKWEVTYCIIVETFEGENSHKFWDFVAICYYSIKISSICEAMKIKHAKKWSAYTRYVVEPSSDKIFLTRKFKPRIIFNAKISRSMVHVHSLTRWWCVYSEF